MSAHTRTSIGKRYAEVDQGENRAFTKLDTTPQN